MPRRVALPVLLALALGAALLHAGDSSPLTNDDVVQMLKWHLDDAGIIQVFGRCRL